MTSIFSRRRLTPNGCAIVGVSLVAAFGAAGCFDVHAASPGPWVIDDFDDGDLQPADPNFGRWFCSTFSPPNQVCALGLDPGDQSTSSAFLQFTIVDPPDGVSQQGGALLQTSATTPENLARFDEMVFSAKLASGTPPLPSTTDVFVQLACSTVPEENGTILPPGDLYLAQIVPIVPPASDWQTFSIPIANIGSPTWVATHPRGGPVACLQRIDTIEFAINPMLPDGQSATGRLDVDDIYFQ
jgi:hypothetical protein